LKTWYYSFLYEQWGKEKKKLEVNNVFFIEDKNIIAKMFNKIN